MRKLASFGNSTQPESPKQLQPNRYNYQPIDALEIRCVRLEPDTEYLKGYLSTVKRDAGGYTALSYPWGESASQDSLRILIYDGDRLAGYLPLTQNLKNALQDLRSTYARSRMFFIDQICINQQDNREKSTQVAYMAEVYSTAEEVVTYLGPAEDSDMRALEFLRDIFDYFQKNLRPALTSKAAAKSLLYHLSHQTFLFELSAAAQEALIDVRRLIYGSGWVKRLWLVRENLINKKVTYLRGTTLIESELVTNFAVTQALLQEMTQGDRLLLTMVRTRTETNLLNLVNLCFEHDCFDPRDRIYSLLGLSSSSWDIMPDYDAAIQGVYTDFAVKAIRNLRSLSVLNMHLGSSNLRSTAPSTSQEHMPSWVPDLRRLSAVTQENGASGWTLPILRLKSNGQELLAEGFQVAEIESFAGELLDESDRNQPHANFDGTKIVQTIGEVHKLLARCKRRNVPGHISRTLTYLTPTHFSQEHKANSECIFRTWLGGVDEPGDAANAMDLCSKCGKHHREPASEQHRLEALKIISTSQVQERSMYTTKGGEIIIASTAVQPGDIAAILLGGSEVYILRPEHHSFDSSLQSENCNITYRFLGPAILENFMNGEVLQDPQWEEQLLDHILGLFKNKYTSTDSIQDMKKKYPMLLYTIGGAISFPEEEQGLALKLSLMHGALVSFLNSSHHLQLQILRDCCILGKERHEFRERTPQDIEIQLLWWAMIDRGIREVLAGPNNDEGLRTNLI